MGTVAAPPQDLIRVGGLRRGRHPVAGKLAGVPGPVRAGTRIAEECVGAVRAGWAQDRVVDERVQGHDEQAERSAIERQITSPASATAVIDVTRMVP